MNEKKEKNIISFQQKPYDKEQAKYISNKYNLNQIISIIIAQKNLTFGEIEEMLNFDYTKFNEKLEKENIKLKNLDIAVKRIKNAINNNEKILIYGDYDADGVTSTSILKIFFERLGINVDSIIPNRLLDGYGLNKKYINKAKEKNIDLIITVDCGIKSIDEVEYINSLNMDCIITDHHEIGEILPNAAAVINPKLGENSNVFNEIAGCAVAFKLVEGVAKELNISNEKYLDLLELVAIGSIADVMPIVNENYILIKDGLNRINNSCSNLGIKTLIGQNTNITSEYLAFNVIPKINASGRMGKNVALELLTANNIKDAIIKLNELEELNNLRKIKTDEGFNIIDKLVQENYLEDNILLVESNEIHDGIIGIVASKIAEKYKKSAVIFCEADVDGKKIYKGSGRAYADLDIYSIFENEKENFLAFGGHTKALGISIEKEKLPEIRKKINKKNLEEKCEKLVQNAKKIVQYNIYLPLKYVNETVYDSLEILEPTGEENLKPTFLFKDTYVSNIFKYGKVVKLQIKNKENQVKNVICFDTEKINKLNLQILDNICIVGKLSKNIFNNNVDIQIIAEEIVKI